MQDVVLRIKAIFEHKKNNITVNNEGKESHPLDNTGSINETMNLYNELISNNKLNINEQLDVIGSQIDLLNIESNSGRWY